MHIGLRSYLCELDHLLLIYPPRSTSVSCLVSSSHLLVNACFMFYYDLEFAIFY